MTTTPDMEYGVDESQPPTRCRLTLNGFTCNIKTKAFGLCANHYQRFLAAKDGGIEKYGLPRRRGSK